MAGPAAETESRPRRGGTALAAVVLAGVAVHAAGLPGELVLDDWANLEPALAWARGELGWREAILAAPASPTARPVVMGTFMATFAAAGPSVLALKLGNLAIHLACGLLVFALARRWLQAAETPAQRTAWLAIFVSAAWLLSPMAPSTVLYVVQRMAQLAALFVLAGLLCYDAGRARLASGRTRSGWAWMAAAFALCWPLATLSKENGALLPLLVFVVEAFVYRARPGSGTPRAVAWLLAATLAVPGIAVFAAMALSPDLVLAGYAARDYTLLERVLSEARALWAYVANLLLLPGGPAFGVFHDDFPVSRGLLDPATTLAAVIGWVVVLAGAIRARRTVLAPAAFGIVFFLAAHALESTVLPLEIYFEHRNYLPSAGLYFAVGAAAGSLLDRVPRPRVVTAVLVVLVAGYGGAAWQHATLWRSSDSLILAAARGHPDSARVQTALASLWTNRGERERALSHLDRAEALSGGDHAQAIALHRIAAWCAGRESAPDRAYARLATLPAPDAGVYAVNALAWITGALEHGRCRGIDAARLARAMRAVLDRAAAQWPLDPAGTPGARDALWKQHLYTARLFGLTSRRRDALPLLARADALAPPGRLEPALLGVRYRIEIGDEPGARRSLAEVAARDAASFPRHAAAIARLRARLGGT